jgi:drug/metabolite transporter (DMT)-like permease
LSIAAILLVVAAAVIHATWNMLAKRAAAAGATFVLAYTAVSAIAYAPWVIWLLLSGKALAWGWPQLSFLLASGLIHLAYSLCLQKAYFVADLSVVYPVARGTGPALSTIGAIVLLGEPASFAGMAGLVLVVAGIGLIATQGELAAFRRPGGQRGVAWGTATGGLIALYTVTDAYAVKILNIAPVVLDWFSNVLRFFLLLPFFLANPRDWLRLMRGHWPAAIGVGLLSPLSYIFVLSALDLGAPLSIVAPMREMSMMVGALMGMFLLRESVTVWRLAGCGILLAGVMLLGSQ